MVGHVRRATHLRPNTLATYTTLLDKWIVPYLGRKRLREITRETIDNYSARLRVDGAGAPTLNRALGVLQGVFHRAVEWRRLAWNPVVGVRRVAHSRAETIDARTPETVEAIRARLDPQNAALVSVLAYEGLRPAEAYALIWRDVIDDRGKPRNRLRVERAMSGEEVSTTKSQRGREPELFRPVARELVELYLAPGRPDASALVFPDSQGGHLRRQNWRRRVWIPTLKRAGVPYFRSYDLRHTCATLLLYEGRTINEVAEHLGHTDPGFTARTYAHVMRDAARRRRITISEAIRTGRAAASRRPLVDPSGAEPAIPPRRSEKKPLQTGRADARTRTGDPFITSERKRVPRGPSQGGRGSESRARCPHCGGLLGTGEAGDGPSDVRREYVEDDEEDLAREADDPRSQRGPSRTTATPPEVAGDEPAG
jgi:integrase